MYTKVVFVALMISTIDAVPQLPAIDQNLFPSIDFASLSTMDKPAPANATTCTCGVFMSGQFKKGSTEQPTGFPALISELDQAYPCNPVGLKNCVNRCLETIIKHMPNSDAIICGTINRDCYKERAHLFVQNCEPKWINSNLAAGREYCCKNHKPYNCPLI